MGGHYRVGRIGKSIQTGKHAQCFNRPALPSGYPNGCPKSLEDPAPQQTSGCPEDTPGDFPDIGTVPRLNHIEQPENDEE